MAKELKPNQDLNINAGLIRMWKKAGLRVKSFKATKKRMGGIWSGEFKTKKATLSMSVDKYGSVFYHVGNKSVNIGRLDKQSKIIDWMKAIIRNNPWAESVNERKLSSQQKKAISIAIEMSGDMTGATKKIEKIKRGLSKDKKVKDALRLANESVNEGNLPSNIQKWIRDRGPKPSKDVKMIGKWVKKLTGHEISGGVAIGMNYNTLVLDIEYQDAAIYYDTTSGDITLYNKKIRNFNGFKKVFQANESVNEATDVNWSAEMMWKWVSKALKTAGIKEVKYVPMKSGWLGGKFVWGGFYTVQAEKRKDVLPFTVDKKGNLHLNVSPKKFIIGKIGKLPQVVKNLKDFKKSDLDVYESVNERTDRFNNVHAETKKELKAAVSKAMKEIAKGKNPRFDIINGRTGEMFGWVEGQEYHWQPGAIADALRELK